MDRISKEQSAFLRNLRDDPNFTSRPLDLKGCKIAEELFRLKYIDVVEWESFEDCPMWGRTVQPVVYDISETGRAYLDTEENEDGRLARAEKRANLALVFSFISLLIALFGLLKP